MVYIIRGQVAERPSDTFAAVKLIPDIRTKLIPMPELVIKKKPTATAVKLPFPEPNQPSPLRTGSQKL